MTAAAPTEHGRRIGFAVVAAPSRVPGRHTIRRTAAAWASSVRRAAGLRVHARLGATYQTLAAAHAAARTLKVDVLPGAQRIFDSAREGYRQGKFGYLDVLDAQRTLFEAKARHLDALERYHQTAVEVERLVGQALDTVAATEEPREAVHDE